MNGVTYDPPSVPTLLQILNGNTDLLPNGTTYFLPRNKTIELSIPSGASGGEVCISQFSTQLNSYTLIVLSASSSFARGESTTILADVPTRHDILSSMRSLWSAVVEAIRTILPIPFAVT